MYWSTEKGASLRSVLSRLPRISRPTKECTELVGYYDETRNQQRGLRPDGSFYGVPTERVRITMLTHDELMAEVANTYDPDLIVEILEISSEELLEAFQEKFKLKRSKFIDEPELEDDEVEEI